ncbi:MAG TPA: VIT domain-containing protein [Chitinophagaceae bacterium]
MRNKLCLQVALLLHISLLHAQKDTRLFDQPMKCNSINMSIQTDAFVATTFVEMEFYNPGEKEIEGLYRFHLDPGQIITDFQLELNGKYRDGSIEERWKARATYSSITGKRMDPALLQYEYDNNYRLNIFPVPAKGIRKITMTIEQLLRQTDEALIYTFPFYKTDTVSRFYININTNDGGFSPIIKRGLLAGKISDTSSDKSRIRWQTEHFSLNGEIFFEVPLKGGKINYCVNTIGRENYYALRLPSRASLKSVIQPKKVLVCWDVSGSRQNRNVKKEINFLRQYVSYYGVSRLIVMPFSYHVLDTVVFDLENNSSDKWESYIRSLNYDGATQLGCLDLSNADADAILLFSDGKNSYGRTMPNIGASLVYCVNSSVNSNTKHLEEITGSNGGQLVDLTKLTITEAVMRADSVHNWLLRISSQNQKITCDQLFPLSAEKDILLTGSIRDSNEIVTLYYGHGNTITDTEKIIGSSKGNCAALASERINMLQRFQDIQKMYAWEDVLDFGLKEKIVTANTSYIVLEKAEDYMCYNIAPPKDLEEECRKLNYVKRNTRSYRQKLKELDEFDIIKNVAVSYNSMLRQLDKNVKIIQLDTLEHQTPVSFQTSPESGPENELLGRVARLSFGSRVSDLQEVVVTGYGSVLKENLTSSVSFYRGNQIQQGLSIEQNLAGKVAGISVFTTGNYFINQPNISIRGISSLPNNNPLYIIDGLPIQGNPNNYIDINNIESITVLKDAASTAIYGGNSGNGVILINSKRGRNYSYYNYSGRYRLRDMEDIEYMQLLKSAKSNERLLMYQGLRGEYGNEANFYFDVAQYFFEVGLKNDALPILLNAAEVSEGDESTLRAIAFVLESWKYFSEAINVYKSLVQSDPYNLHLRRDLAWAYYQNGNYQEAVNTLYQSIKLNLLTDENSCRSFKAGILDDMNAIIAIKKSHLDISMIPAELIKPLAVDLKVMIEGNGSESFGVTVVEPGGAKCSLEKPATRNGGYMNVSSCPYFYHGSIDYQTKEALHGNYKIRVDYHDYYYYSSERPSVIRIVSFKNFGKADQSIDIDNVIMNNQNGDIEIGQVKWTP